MPIYDNSYHTKTPQISEEDLAKREKILALETQCQNTQIQAERKPSLGTRILRYIFWGEEANARGESCHSG